eukprot:1651703-Amphidinium_carterae.1
MVHKLSVSNTAKEGYWTPGQVADHLKLTKEMFASLNEFQAAIQCKITAWQDKNGVSEDKRMEESPGGLFWTNKFFYGAS